MAGELQGSAGTEVNVFYYRLGEREHHFTKKELRLKYKLFVL
jgi:hypothetical protein